MLYHFAIGAGSDEDYDDSGMRLVGVYSTEARALAAIERLSDAPGFRDWPGGFRTYDTELGWTTWTDGFREPDADHPPAPDAGRGDPAFRAAWRWLDRTVLRDEPCHGDGAGDPAPAVFKLLHFRLGEGEDEAAALGGKGIGTYATREAAAAAIAEVRDAPGFRDWPGGVRVLEVVLDRTGWAGGFVRDREGAGE